MIILIDILNASVAALLPVTITGVVIGIAKVSEFNAYKKSTQDWMRDTIKQMDRHESNDENRQKEVLSRIESAEKNILENWKELVKK